MSQEILAIPEEVKQTPLFKSKLEFDLFRDQWIKEIAPQLEDERRKRSESIRESFTRRVTR